MANMNKFRSAISAMQTSQGRPCIRYALTLWVIGLIAILYVQITQSADEPPNYTQRRTMKTVVSRPAMRIYRYRPSNRKVSRPTIYRAKPGRRIVSSDNADIPGLRRVIWTDGRYVPKSRGNAIAEDNTTTTTTVATTTIRATIVPPTATVAVTERPTTTIGATVAVTERPTTTIRATAVPPTATVAVTERPTTTIGATTVPPTTTVAVTERPVSKNVTISTSTSPATTSTTTTNTATTTSTTREITTTSFRKPTRYRGRYNGIPFRRPLNKDLDISDLIKKLDFFIAYYPSVRDAATRLTTMMSKYEQTSREERRRIWKGVFRVKSDLRHINTKCNVMYRNITEVGARLIRQTKSFGSYQQVAQRKIKDIETHQGTQDDQYYELFRKSKNNTQDIQRLTSDMAVLLPIVGNLMENYERNNLQEKKALEMLDSHARGNIADMTNQILVQQNTLENLGNQVRSEMDLLHAEKQTMAKRMEQHQRRLTETVNTHLSSHVRQINKIEGSINRQTEKIKYVSAMISKHDDKLDSNQVLVLAFMDQVANTSDGLEKMKSDITRFIGKHYIVEMGMNGTKEAVDRLERNTQQLASSLNSQHEVISETMERVNITEEALRSVSHELDAYKVKQGAETEDLREDLDAVLSRQRTHHDNITSLFSWGETPSGRGFVDHYPSDEPAPASATVTPQELRALLTEIGIEDQMSRFTRVLRHQQQRMSNVTTVILRLAEDNEAITTTTSHYFNLINSQAKVIKDQNETISKLAMIAATQGDTIKTLSSELSSGQEMVMKLTNILVNVATQMKSPMGSQRDCHDLWMNGNKKSGVYNVIENMKLRPVQCNMTKYGGWTIIQRRKDGSQDFDQTMKDYEKGFGDIYGEHWLGLEGIQTFTQKVRASVGLQIVMEDWSGNVRKATYSQFYIYGKSYKLALGGYSGNAGDSLTQSNGLPFMAKNGHDEFAKGSCSSRRHAGWWFTSPTQNCGESNLNGAFRNGPTQDARILSTIYWKRWHGVGYPLKCVTMQIIPTDIINQMREDELNGHESFSNEVNGQASPSDGINGHGSSTSTGINGHTNNPNSYAAYQDNILNDNPYRGEPYGAQSRSSAPAYEEVPRQSDTTDPPDSDDYDNFDYNAIFNDG